MQFQRKIFVYSWRGCWRAWYKLFDKTLLDYWYGWVVSGAVCLNTVLLSVSWHDTTFYIHDMFLHSFYVLWMNDILRLIIIFVFDKSISTSVNCSDWSPASIYLIFALPLFDTVCLLAVTDTARRFPVQMGWNAVCCQEEGVPVPKPSLRNIKGSERKNCGCWDWSRQVCQVLLS